MFFRKSRSLVTVLAVVLAVTAVPTRTLANAAGTVTGSSILKEELQDARKHRVIRQIQEFSKRKGQILTRIHRARLSGMSVQNAEIPSEVTYSGKVSTTHTAEYVFKVGASSRIQITAGHSDSSVQYWLIGTDSAGNVAFYENGDTLAPGTYSFVVYNISSGSLVDYSYRISGVTFAEAPDTEIPNLSFTRPTARWPRLPMGTSSLTFAGTVDSYAEFTWNSEAPKVLNSSFEETVPLKFGMNTAHFYAVRPSGNTVYDEFYPVLLGMKRLDGANRYVVSANISKELPDSSTIVIARGDLFTDALSGGSIAGLEGAPILLTPTSALPQVMLDEIKRRSPSKAIILGGTDSVSVNVENQLRSLGVQKIERIGGPNRFAVSAGVANKVTATLGAQAADTAIIASGLVFPDALAASGVSYNAMVPILLVSTDRIPAEIDSFLKTHPNIKRFVIVGGTGTVSDTVANQLKNTCKAELVQRVDGKNRFEVATNVARRFMLDYRAVVVARGDGNMFADALCGGPLAASLSPAGSPLLLTHPTTYVPELETCMNQISGQNDTIYILGGTDSVSPYIESKLAATLK